MRCFGKLELSCEDDNLHQPLVGLLEASDRELTVMRGPGCAVLCVSAIYGFNQPRDAAEFGEIFPYF